MFTGLIEAMGRVVRATDEAPVDGLTGAADDAAAQRLKRLVLATPWRGDELPAVGASVAIDGTCLTVTVRAPATGELTFEAATETRRRTTLGTLVAGDTVHLERALRFGDRLDGHLVSGHVDGVGAVTEARADGSVWRLSVAPPAAVLRLSAPQGAITLAGVSLTIVAIDGPTLSVGLVPHTLERTTLGRLRPGARINCEADLLARYVAALLPLTAAGPAPTPSSMAFARVDEALRALRAGRMVVLVDDEGRENEGDLCLAADCTLPADINFMVTHGRGLVCLALPPERADALELAPMVAHNTSSFGTGFTVSIEAASGVTTGISAADRAHTIRTAMNVHAKASDLARPGHVFPLRARAAGVLTRDGQTEGSVDLARLAGRAPGAVICEVLSADGTMARLPELAAFAARHKLVLLSVAELIAYRFATEALLAPAWQLQVTHPSFGPLTLTAFRSSFDAREHLLVSRGVAPLLRGAVPAVGLAPADVATRHRPAKAVLEGAPAAPAPAPLADQRGQPPTAVAVAVADLPVTLPASDSAGLVALCRPLEATLAAPRAAGVLCTPAERAPVPLVRWLVALAGPAAARSAPAEASEPAPGGEGGPAGAAARGIVGGGARARWRLGVAGQLLRSLPPGPAQLTEPDPDVAAGLLAAGVELGGAATPLARPDHGQNEGPVVWPGPALAAGPLGGLTPQRAQKAQGSMNRP